MSDGWEEREFMYRWQLSSGQLHSYHVCNGKPTNKAVNFLMAKKTTHTNQKSIVLLSFNVDVKF